MPAQPQIATIICPKCGMTLPGRALFCQFCQADLKGVARPPDPALQKSSAAANQPVSWKLIAYYIMGVWWIFNGITIALSSAQVLSKLVAGPGAIFSGIPAIGIIIGVIYALVGLGLLIKIELARGIVNILSWLTIGFGLLNVWSAIMMGAVFGPAMVIPLLMAVLNISIAGLQIYIIGETETFMN